MRWQPTRAGLLNVWRYHDEVLTFHQGRLLLRGANGSGKSMALELLLPFLLDASLQPGRLSSAQKSRGGLYDRMMAGADGTGRIGFLWAEFRAGDRTFTIGVRLRASSNTRTVDRDWFTTTLVVGDSLHLLDESRSPLPSRRALSDAIGGAGTVYESGEEYRAAVRAQLFGGFDARQYDAVITTLLALRQEKVSQDLTPAKLSEILTASLPPVDEYRIAEVAEGFERLDRRKESIAQLDRDITDLDRLARRNKTYARAVLAGLADRVRATQNDRDNVTRDERATRAELEAQRSEEQRVVDEGAEAEQAVADLVAEVDTLKNLDAYKEGARLVPLRGEADRARQRLEEEEQAEGRAAAELERAAGELATREGGLRVARGNEEAAGGDLDHRADEADAGAIVEQAAALAPDTADEVVATWASTRRAASRAVRAALTAHEAADAERVAKEGALEDERESGERASAAVVAAEDALDAAVSEFRSSTLAWARACTELDGEGLASGLAEPELVTDPVASVAFVRAEAAPVLESLAIGRARLGADVAANVAEAEGLREQRAVLAAGRTPEPDAVAWRTPAGRDGRRGAPLWRLLDFRNDAPGSERDAVEAALLASGLLDAWVDPSGDVRLPESVADAFAQARVEPVAGHSLRAVLVPSASGDQVAPAIVEALLASVALVDSAAGGDEAVGSDAPAIGLDATFRLGPLVGRAPATPARYIGAAAQERARLARMAEIDRTLEGLARAAAELGRTIETIDRTRAAVEAEVAAFPSGHSVFESRRQLDLAGQRAEDASARVERAAQAVRQAEEAARQAQAALARLAAAHRLPAEPEALDEYDERLVRFERSARAWANRRREVAGAELLVTAAREAAGRARETAAAASDRRDAAGRVAAELASRLRTLEEAVGERYRDVESRIAAAVDEQRRQTERGKSLAERRLQLVGTIARVEEKVLALEDRRVEVEAAREEAHRHFAAAVAEGLAADAGIELPSGGLAGVGAVIEASRAVTGVAGAAAPDEAALSRAEGRLFEELHQVRQSLLGRLELTLEQSGHGWWTLRTVSGGLRRSITATVVTLNGDRAAARAEFEEEEHRLFEETLSGNVRMAVADRLRRARALVDGVNIELVGVRTEASGVGVRLKWEVDPEQPAAVRSARNLLLQDAADWSDDERTGMYSFFRARLDDARAKLDGTAGWEDRLREALDYRRWHRFVLELRHQDGDGYQPATSQRLARLSTGERSIALHLPMLAAVAAHYDGGGPPAGQPACPRLILLDELFAGVDAVNRRQLFGMFVAWDLDAVFTSDHEWCAYDSLDGIAIHHLHPAEPGEPVTTSRFVWDGRRRRAAALEPVLG